MLEIWDESLGSYTALVCLCASALPAVAGVTVTTPTNGATVGSPVHFVASASSPACSKGVSAVGIYTAPGVLAYVVNGTKLDTNFVEIRYAISGGAGMGQLRIVRQSATYRQCWVQAGGWVARPSPTCKHASGWTGYALLPPNFPICSSCTFDRNSGEVVVDTQRQLHLRWMAYHKDHLRRRNDTVGRHPLEQPPDRRLFFPGPSRLQQDTGPSLHNFTYDVYFWIGNASDSQALEFDINQFVSGKSYIWGHECRIDGGHEWDTWNNQTEHWVPSGIPCNPKSNAWNHSDNPGSAHLEQPAAV